MSWHYRVAWTREFRKRMFRGGESFCAYCAQKLSPETATVDHVIPKHNGGSNRVSNYILACGPCNFQRGKETIFDKRKERPPVPCLQCSLFHRGKCPLSPLNDFYQLRIKK